jgi:hypothetical protein
VAIELEVSSYNSTLFIITERSDTGDVTVETNFEAPTTRRWSFKMRLFDCFVQESTARSKTEVRASLSLAI